MNAIRDHRIAAGVLGVPVARYRGAVFVPSSMYAGLAGVPCSPWCFQRTGARLLRHHALSLEYLAMIVIRRARLRGRAPSFLAPPSVSLLRLLTRYSDAPARLGSPGTGGVSSPARHPRYLYGAAIVAMVLSSRTGDSYSSPPAVPGTPPRGGRMTARNPVNRTRVMLHGDCREAARADRRVRSRLRTGRRRRQVERGRRQDWLGISGDDRPRCPHRS